MIGRRPLLAIALLSGLLAGILYLAGSQRAAVVVAAHDLDALRPLTVDDLETRPFLVEAVPDGAFDDVRRVVGRVPRAPLQRGQLVLAGAIADHPAAFASGLTSPRGTRAIAIPAGPAQALGGALSSGARVDIIAVPATGRAPATRTVELVASAALVLDVRGESGAPLVPGAARTGAASRERIGSVVVAIPVSEELRIAERTATSTFVFVLSATAER